MKSIHKIALLLFLVPALTLANDTGNKKHERSKEINKTFKVNSNATLDVSNKYGDVNVTTWSQNTIQIDVLITVKGNDLGNVEDQLEMIDVEFNSSASLVEAKTVFEKKNSWFKWGRNRKISYKIDYTIKMPVTNNVDLSNDYGAISLSELDGEANISCDYGKISIGDLRGDNTKISLDYCSNSSVNSMKNGSVNIDYSKLSIENSQSVKLNADYSNAKFKNVESLNFNTDYGNVEAENVGSADGNGDYTSFRFGTISNKLKLMSDYGSIRIKNLAKGFESVYINSEYAGIKIGIDPSASFDFQVDLQYAGFRKGSGNIEIFKSIEKSTKKYYEGVYGKGKSGSKVTIKSQYGSVSFYEN